MFLVSLNSTCLSKTDITQENKRVFKNKSHSNSIINLERPFILQ